MQNSMVVFTFSVLDQKNPFRANLVQKIKIVSLSWNLVQNLIRICRIQWWCSLFLFLTINILGQIWSKNSKLFKVKFDRKSNSNMQNSMIVSILSALDWKYLFWANLVQKIEIVNLSRKLVLSCTYWYLLIDVHFFCFWPEVSFFWNLFHKSKLFVEAEI